MNYWSILVPVCSAIIGWIGIWTAGKIFVYKILASRRTALAEKIGKIVSSEISTDEIEKKITDPERIRSIMPVVEEHVDDFLRNKLKAKMPVIGMFIGDKTIQSLKEVFLKEIEDLFPEVLSRFAGNLREEINIEKMVSAKITSVSSGRIEKALAPAFRYYQYSGAITGLVIGIIDLVIFYFMYK